MDKWHKQNYLHVIYFSSPKLYLLFAFNSTVLSSLSNVRMTPLTMQRRRGIFGDFICDKCAYSGNVIPKVVLLL